MARSYRGSMSVVKRSMPVDALRQRGLAAIAEYEAECGAFTEEELAEADRILDEASVVDLTTTAKPKRAQRSTVPPSRRRRA